MHIYLDDLFIYLDNIEDHKEHLRIVFKRLRKNSLYLKWLKCNLYVNKVDCLGHIIDDNGIHTDTGKLHRILEWCMP